MAGNWHNYRGLPGHRSWIKQEYQEEYASYYDQQDQWLEANGWADVEPPVLGSRSSGTPQSQASSGSGSSGTQSQASASSGSGAVEEKKEEVKADKDDDEEEVEVVEEPPRAKKTRMFFGKGGKGKGKGGKGKGKNAQAAAGEAGASGPSVVAPGPSVVAEPQPLPEDDAFEEELQWRRSRRMRKWNPKN